jgi:hypothetical protein
MRNRPHRLIYRQTEIIVKIDTRDREKRSERRQIEKADTHRTTTNTRTRRTCWWSRTAVAAWTRDTGQRLKLGARQGYSSPGVFLGGAACWGGCRIRSRIIGAWVPCATCVQLVSQARGFDILIVVYRTPAPAGVLFLGERDAA